MSSKLRLCVAGGFVAGAAALMIAGCSLGVKGDESSSESGSPPGAAAPSDGVSASGGETPSSRYGKVAFRLVDAPADVQSIFVTISRLDAEVAGTWRTLLTREETIDLLTLQNGASLDLGTAALPPGHVGQLRLHLAEGSEAHMTTKDGALHPLTIPSAAQSGIKLVGGFDVPECASGQVTIDFDGEKSLQLHSAGENAGSNGKGKNTDGGADEKWMLRPVVRIKALVMKGECPNVADAGDDAVASDAGDAEPLDPCASVTCSETELCDNGTCRYVE
ncbi:MAG TPA: DUF4382 domain-containing protein [Labilithrix sp.]|jgi:hypothetical protein|nr:DUF4382 domain-containing protein [Labilithrix sp.]